MNIMEFCKQFNARTQDKTGKIVPVVITVYADKSFDFIFSLGVLHHIPKTNTALYDLVKKVKPNCHVLIYLYYNLDNRGAFYKLIFTISNPIRYVIAKLPKTVKHIVCDISAIGVYLPIITIEILAKKLFPNSSLYKKYLFPTI